MLRDAPRGSRPLLCPLRVIIKNDAPVISVDYEIGEKNHMQGFVCDDHKLSERVEKLAQPQTAKAAFHLQITE
jgi:hypothetical protein